MGRRDGTLKQTLRTMSCSGLIEISNLGARIPVPSAGRGRLTADRGASIRPVVGSVRSLVARRPWPSLSSPRPAGSNAGLWAGAHIPWLKRRLFWQPLRRSSSDGCSKVVAVRDGQRLLQRNHIYCGEGAASNG